MSLKIGLTQNADFGVLKVYFNMSKKYRSWALKLVGLPPRLFQAKLSHAMSIRSSNTVRKYIIVMSL